MPGYDSRYDYGLRGYRETTRPMMDNRYAARRYDYGYRGAYDYSHRVGHEERAHPEERLRNRVTARYNRDYVMGYRNRDERYGTNYQMYTGDYPGRMGDDRWMRQPYITHGGTRTLRGSSYPTGYDYPNYGPNYGGWYPDEL